MYQATAKSLVYQRKYRYCKKDGYAIEDCAKTARIKNCELCGSSLFPRTVEYPERGRTK